MLKRVLAGTAVALVSLMSAATSAQAQITTTAPPSAPPSRATVVGLHHAYLAHLGHTKAAKLAIMYARGRRPKSAKAATSCSEPNCPLT